MASRIRQSGGPPVPRKTGSIGRCSRRRFRGRPDLSWSFLPLSDERAFDGLTAREGRLAALERGAFDVLVVGGGITGAACARDAASRGLSVALIEKDDWASGTSWRSSKLVHGGLRYLRQGEIRLVFESLSERARLGRLAPHLVRRLDFLFAILEGRWVSPLTLSAGLTLYDLLALGRGPGHRILSSPAALAAEPLLSGAPLRGGALYTDARVDDARLTLENVLDAAALGCVAVSGVSLEERHAGEGVTARETESGRSLQIRARTVIEAGGPWTDALARREDPRAPAAVRLSKGAHVTVAASRLPVRRAVVVPVESGRLFFAIPWGPVTLLGTTDTDYSGPPDRVRPAREDVDYLLARAAEAFPAAGLSRGDVLASFAGLRPLRFSASGEVSAATREEFIRASGGFVRVTGGKLTTHRRTGARAVDAVAAHLRRSGRRVPASATKDRPFPGAPEEAFEAFADRFVASARVSGVDEPLARHLADRYGARAPRVLAVLEERPELSRPLDPALPDAEGEVVFAARFEDARSVADALIRRTHVFWQARGQGLTCAGRVARLLGRELGWTPKRTERSAADYEAEVAVSRDAFNPA